MKNILLYLSAFIPMYVLVFIKQMVDMIIGASKASVYNFIVLAFLVVLVVLGAVGLILELSNKSQKMIKIKIICKKNTTDEHFLGYFSLFVLFAISFNLTRLSMFIIFVLILVMIGVVYVKNKLFYINPLLNLLGYNFYDINYVLDSGEEQTTKIFFKVDFLLNKEYFVKIKDENFSFVDNKRKK